jgi:EAL domain-containing protein (putative c-di-GMP-specific phosphodiesterase class I)
VRSTTPVDITKRESAAIIRAVTTLASALSVPVCVEGIENEAAFNAVVRLGCEIGQGWYFGKAMPAESACDLLASRTSQSAQPPLSALG